MNGQTPLLVVSPSDIATLAQVTPAAVSNWRKRHIDFPAPIAGTPGNPLFSMVDTIAWLASRNQTVVEDRGELAVWASLNVIRDDVSAYQTAQIILSLCCARKLSAAQNKEAAFQRLLVAAKRKPGALQTEIANLFKVLDSDENLLRDPMGLLSELQPQKLQLLIESVSDSKIENLSRITNFALERLAKAMGKAGSNLDSIDSRVTTLLANLVTWGRGDWLPSSLYDPACGVGSTLLKIASTGGRYSSTPPSWVGHDYDPISILIARQRAFLQDAKIEFRETNILAIDPEPDLKSEIILLSPQVGVRIDASQRHSDPRFVFGTPPASSAETAWLQHVVAHLDGDNARGYVLTSSRPLANEGPERSIRTELVRQGCIEAIVGLPGKLLSHTSIPLALWVLKLPADEPEYGRIRFIDASSVDQPESLIADWLLGAVGVHGVPDVAVSVSDVLAAGANLIPNRWTQLQTQLERDIRERLQNAADNMHHQFENLDLLFWDFKVPADLSRSRVVTIGELIDQGVLELRAGRQNDDQDCSSSEFSPRILTVSDIRASGSLEEVEATVPEGNPDDLTEPEDVLVTTLNEIHAKVDLFGGHIPSVDVYRLRVLDQEAMIPQFLAAILPGKWNNRFMTGKSVLRASLRELEIPNLSPHDQGTIHLALINFQMAGLRAELLKLYAEEAEHLLRQSVWQNVFVDDDE